MPGGDKPQLRGDRDSRTWDLSTPHPVSIFIWQLTCVLYNKQVSVNKCFPGSYEPSVQTIRSEDRMVGSPDVQPVRLTHRSQQGPSNQPRKCGQSCRVCINSR